MLALIAAICFLLALLGVSAPFDIVLLAWLFVALHLAIGAWPLGGPAPWNRG